MTKISRVIGVLAVGGVLGGACSSSSPSDSGSGGTTGSGGKSSSGGSTGSGGTTGSGGKVGSGGTVGSGGASSGGKTGSGGNGSGGSGSGGSGSGGTTGGEVVVACAATGGAVGTGGTTSSGGVVGGGGAGGTSSAGGKGGAGGGKGGAGGGKGGAGGGKGGAGGGKGGAGGGAPGAGGAPPTCQQIPPLAGTGGSSSFTLSSSEWTSCSPIPAAHTCDQKPFPQGTSPVLTWTAGPSGTMSYAVVLKDLSVLARTDPSDPLYNRGFHYVIWDIPASVTSLPANMKDGFVSTDVPGALQWSNFNDYGFFGPCPNFDPNMPTSYNDSYAFVVYALPTAKTTIPATPADGTSPVRVLDGVFQAAALATAEYRGTSSAASSGVPDGVLPPSDVPPCPADNSVTCGCVKRAQ